jgi:hypothetical protein
VKEGLKCPVQSVQHILQDLRGDVAVFRAHAFDARQLGGLHGEAHVDAALLPGGFPLFQARVVEFAATPQDTLQRLFVCGCWHEFVLVRLADAVALLFHTQVFCLIGEKRQLSGRSWPFGPPGFHLHA